MIKGIRKLLTSRILWVALLLLLEVGLIALFVYAIAGSIKELYDLTLLQIIIIVAVFLFIVSGLTVIYIVNSHVKAAYKVAWLVVVALLPLVGCFFYLLFSNKKITNRQKRKIQPIIDVLSTYHLDPKIKKKVGEESPDALKMAEYITHAAGAYLHEHSQVKYYPSGEAVFSTMLNELKKAKKFIFIEYFIIAPGKFWDSILEILKQKVKEGVDVRLIYDDVGSAKHIPANYDKKMNALGIKTFAFHKFKPIIDVKLNNRDHRKIMVIDGKVAFSGGINLADEYININSPFGYWKDNAIKITGEAVYSFTALFFIQWLSISGADISQFDTLSKKYIPYFPDENSKVKSDGYVEPYGDLPYDDESVGERVYLNLINSAKKYIYITTPYLIIDDEIVNALINAAKQNVDVRIITPRIPDKKTVFRITRSHYRLLLKNGVKIYEYVPGFVHAKMFVVDDVFAVVGTINLDYRSLYLHLENATFMYKTSCIKDMKADCLKMFKDSEEITYQAYRAYAAPRRFVWSVLRLFAPLF